MWINGNYYTNSEIKSLITKQNKKIELLKNLLKCIKAFYGGFEGWDIFQGRFEEGMK